MRALPLLSLAVLACVQYSNSEVFRHIQCFERSVNGSQCNQNSAQFCVTYPEKSGSSVCNTQITLIDNGIPKHLKHCKTSGCGAPHDWGRENLVGTHCCCDVIDCDSGEDDALHEGDVLQDSPEAGNSTIVIETSNGTVV